MHKREIPDAWRRRDIFEPPGSLGQRQYCRPAHHRQCMGEGPRLYERMRALTHACTNACTHTIAGSYVSDGLMEWSSSVALHWSCRAGLANLPRPPRTRSRSSGVPPVSQSARSAPVGSTIASHWATPAFTYTYMYICMYVYVAPSRGTLTTHGRPVKRVGFEASPVSPRMEMYRRVRRGSRARCIAWGRGRVAAPARRQNSPSGGAALIGQALMLTPRRPMRKQFVK